MLHILLIILKLLGLLLLVILGLLILILLTVLFVPVRYRADLSACGEKTGIVRVTWLLGLAQICAQYDGSVKVTVKVLWKRFFDRTVWPEENGSEGEQTEDLTEKTEQVRKEFTDEKPVDAIVAEPEKTKEPAKVPETVKKEDFAEPHSEHDDRVILEAQEIKDGIPEKLERFIRNAKEKTQEIREALKNGSEKVSKVRSILTDEENQKTVRLIFRQVKKIIRHILPQKLSGRIRFGFEDPAMTGQILAAVSPFYGLYARTLALEPVFDEKVLEGELHFRGRIRIFSILWAAVRVLLNKNFRKQLRNLRSR